MFPKNTQFKTNHISWNKNKTKERFPQLSNSGRKRGFISHRKGISMTKEYGEKKTLKIKFKMKKGLKKAHDEGRIIWFQKEHPDYIKDHSYKKLCKNTLGKTWSLSTKSKKNIQKASLLNWRNPKYVKKLMKSLHIKPNKPEICLQKFFNTVAPQEYKFVGDGQFILGGKCPDFTNINGKKKLIELFGDYWHGKKRTGKSREWNEHKRIQHFKNFGFDTLVIWEHELKDLQKLKDKILNFNKI